MNRSCCHGNVGPNATPKSHRPWLVLFVGRNICRYVGGKCPRVHLNPVDAPAGSFCSEGARALIINRVMMSLI